MVINDFMTIVMEQLTSEERIALMASEDARKVTFTSPTAPDADQHNFPEAGLYYIGGKLKHLC